jgi:SNF2 family DNA or RNA helicase
MRQLAAHDYHLLILDEAQTVKNTGSQAAQAVRLLRARHRLCLTGTPMENHLGELWASSTSCCPASSANRRTSPARGARRSKSTAT